MARCILELKIVPNTPRTEVIGWLGEALKLKVHAPPVEGRANEELRMFLADLLGLPKRAVTLARGEHSPRKVVVIEGRTRAEVEATIRLTLPLSAQKPA